MSRQRDRLINMLPMIYILIQLINICLGVVPLLMVITCNIIGLRFPYIYIVIHYKYVKFLSCQKRLFTDRKWIRSLCTQIQAVNTGTRTRECLWVYNVCACVYACVCLSRYFSFYLLKWNPARINYEKLMRRCVSLDASRFIFPHNGCDSFQLYVPVFVFTM